MGASGGVSNTDASQLCRRHERADVEPAEHPPLKEILKSPIYAGSYAYGRRCEKKILVGGEIRMARQSQVRHEWIALIEASHEGLHFSVRPL
jgi:hypothetical protein